ncbi:hypothetical protein KIN20_029609 [Parelaphostrongylus tenuis]|uniref:Uncharacterized protein n=1 Tax=Parelaphostrongylus tenuis TaxID=148309 RepID=A0AAD5R3H9_PARTN|nr:hypothetical protein KIN20_029609 [Parelaphostrongylus tenuis]
MQTVINVLQIERRRALLPDFVISHNLGQLGFNTTYEPLQRQSLRTPVDEEIRLDSKHHYENWSRQMWQSVVNRAVQMVESGPFGSHFFRHLELSVETKMKL